MSKFKIKNASNFELWISFGHLNFNGFGILRTLTFEIYGLLRKVFLPNLLDPIDQLPEFIQKDHLIEVLIQ